MKKLIPLMLFIILLLISASCVMAEFPENLTFDNNGAVYLVCIPGYTSPGSELTNCYILANSKKEAIIIDPADQLDFIDGVKLLVDRETGASIQVTDEELLEYQVLERGWSGPSKVQKADQPTVYLVYDKFTSTGVYAKVILDTLASKKLTLKKIIITHGHLDHFAAVTVLKEKTGAEVIMHENAMRGIDGAKLIRVDGKLPTGYPKDAYRITGITTAIDRPVIEGDEISIPGITLRVIFTPGHSPGGICLLTRKGKTPMLFSGDTLLHWYPATDIFGEVLKDELGRDITFDTGRTNFLDGSGDETLLYRMISEKLLVLPDATVVYPGHNETTTIGEEKKHSPARFVKVGD